jgi:hypothetical protein
MSSYPGKARAEHPLLPVKQKVASPEVTCHMPPTTANPASDRPEARDPTGLNTSPPQAAINYFLLG